MLHGNHGASTNLVKYGASDMVNEYKKRTKDEDAFVAAATALEEATEEDKKAARYVLLKYRHTTAVLPRI